MVATVLIGPFPLRRHRHLLIAAPRGPSWACVISFSSRQLHEGGVHLPIQERETIVDYTLIALPTVN